MNDKTGGNRGLWDAGALAVAAAVTVLATGCGIVHVHFGSAAGSGTTVQGSYQGELAYAKCMRNHGLPGFPDPSPSGSFSWHLTASPGSPTARANDACKHLLTSGSTATNSP